MNTKACGLRDEGKGFRMKLFENVCELMKHGCNVDEPNAVDISSQLHGSWLRRDCRIFYRAYGLINTEYCDVLFGTSNNMTADYVKIGKQKLKNDVDNMEIDGRKFKNAYIELNKSINCEVTCDNTEENKICGIREEGIGFRIRLFQNHCELTKHNCENNSEFIITDLFICRTEFNISKGDIKNSNVVTKNVINEIDDINKYGKNGEENVKNLIVVNSKMFGQYDNISDSIDTFFAASHVFDLPLKEVPLNTRRMLLKNAGPIKVFVPWISKPANISNDTLYRPTLSSCYHKCPFRCPDTYAPVCGVPGVVAREPSLMFQNHCFMDVAQCKMFWENKSSTSHSSSYVESSFLFCMGDEMNAVYRFMPTIRTLQHMGRLKKKGKFRAILKNFRFVSEFRYGRPRFMGK